MIQKVDSQDFIQLEILFSNLNQLEIRFDNQFYKF